MAKNKKRLLLHRLLILFWLASFVSGCASMQSPTGGPKDSIPPGIVNEIPKNWDILYLDYDKNEMNHLGTFLKQCFYCFQHFFGLMKFNCKMIWNYYSKPFSKHLRKAGYHYFADAYAISNYGCKKIIELQTPIIFPADHVLPWAITNELLVGFLCVPKLVMQTSQQGDGSTSMVINPF